MMNNSQQQKIKKTVLVSALLIELSLSAQAATIVVDDVNCLLDDAITSANTDAATGGCDAGSGPDVLTLPQNATITLTSALPEITTDITMQGDNTTIERDVNSATFRILTVNGGSLQLSDSTISHGDVSDTLGGPGPFNTGGGIQVESGNLNLVRTTVSHNQGGGVLFMNSTGSISDSVIHNNQGFDVYDYFYGAGVTVNCSNVAIYGTTIHSNETAAFPGGAGLIHSGGCATTLDVTNTTISNNTSNAFGGGILTDANSGTLNLSQVTVTQNVCAVVTSQARGCGMNSFNTTTNINQSLFTGNENYSIPGTYNEINTNGNGVTVDTFSLIGLDSNSGSYGLTPGYGIPTESSLDAIIDTNMALNGGVTPTHALVLTGPAIDTIPDGSCASPVSQNNQIRPTDVFGSGTPMCDVGAFEAPSDIIFKNGLDN